ncbi:MAG: hypothetical protein GX115_00260 [Ruminiclostridium sp.]|nr:hypothetical protein [Ruminiclostridium sp.]
MITFALLVCIVSILDISMLVKEKNKTGIFIFIAIALITLTLGYFYFTKSSKDSFANLFFRTLKISY